MMKTTEREKKLQKRCKTTPNPNYIILYIIFDILYNTKHYQVFIYIRNSIVLLI